MSRSNTAILILIALGLVAFLFLDQPVAVWIHENIRDEDKGFIWLLGRPGRAENWALVALGFLAAPRASLFLC